MNQQDTPANLLAGTLHGEKSYRPPCICPGGMMNMLTTEAMDLCHTYWPEAHSDPVLMARLGAAPFAAGLFDNIGVPFCMTVEAEAMGRVTAYAISSVEQWDKLSPVSLDRGRAKVVLDALALIRTQ